MNETLTLNHQERRRQERDCQGRRWLVATVLALTGMTTVAGCGGCGDSSTSPRTQGDTPLTMQLRGEFFGQAVNNLNRLEQFDSNEVYGQIASRLGPQGAAEAAKLGHDALMQTCPRSEMLQQIVNRLNQWIPTQEPPDWRLDPLVADLPEPLGKLSCVERLDAMEFSDYDGFALREAVWLRDVSNWARGEDRDPVGRAKELFDWTVRNIQFEANDALGWKPPDWIARQTQAQDGRLGWSPLMPWETLLFGRATAMERARLFILLARQQNIDAVLLRPGKAKGSGRKPPPTWVAVLVDGKLYLFDPALGLPIPAPDGVRLADEGSTVDGPLDIQPATLSQVVADDALLRQLDFDTRNPYGVTSADLKRMVVLVEASPSYLSRRMKLVESRLEPKWKMVLTTSPTAVADRIVARLEELGIESERRLWTFPFETIQQRLQLDEKRIRHRLLAMLPFYSASVEEIVSETSSDTEILDLNDDTLAYKTLSTVARSQPVAAPLRKGRVLYLKGKFDAQPTPIQCLVKTVKPDRQLDEQQAQWSARFEAILREQLRARNRQLPEAEIQKVALRIAHERSQPARRAKQDAGYWLGLIAFQQGDYHLVIERLSEKTLEASSGGPWEHGARYNLARTFEASGDHGKAIDYYLSNRLSPDYHGGVLRARWLKGQETLADQPPVDQPSTDEKEQLPPEPAAAVPEPTIEEPTIEEPQPSEAD